MSDLDKIRAAERAARLRSAVEREQLIRLPGEPPPITSEVHGGVLVDGPAGVSLLGEPLVEGDVIELFVDARTGWLRGRFADGPPRLVLELHAPFASTEPIGSAQVQLPGRAIVRRPPTLGPL